MSKQHNQPHNRRFKFLVTLLLIATVSIISGVAYTSSQTTPFKLDPEFVYVLPAYNTSIGFDSYVYCDKYGWNDDNATNFLLYNTYMASGTSINTLQVSAVDGNLSFTTLNRYGCSFTLSNFGGNANISLVGFGQEPNDITIDSVSSSNYTYTKSGDILTLLTNGTSVVITYPGSSFTADDAVAIAVALTVVAIGVCLAFIFVMRGRQQNE